MRLLLCFKWGPPRNNCVKIGGGFCCSTGGFPVANRARVSDELSLQVRAPVGPLAPGRRHHAFIPQEHRAEARSTPFRREFTRFSVSFRPITLLYDMLGISPEYILSNMFRKADNSFAKLKVLMKILKGAEV